jgi:PilZ domain
MDKPRIASQAGDSRDAQRKDGQGKDERRKDDRAPLDAPIWLRILGRSEPDAKEPAIEGRIMNISKRGMKLRLPKSLQPGMSVQARMAGKIVMAEVRYSNARGAEFEVGIEIQDVFPIPGAASNE